MRQLLLALPACLLLAANAVASPHAAPSYSERALAEILERVEQGAVGQLTGTDLLAALGELSIGIQRDQYVDSLRHASFKLPGLGQLRGGDTGAGLLFAGASVAVFAGTVLGSYALLPADLKLDQLDYFADSYTTIESRWQAHSFNDLLPALGVAAAGTAVHLALRIWAARHARQLASGQIDSGAVSFVPQLGIGFVGLRTRLHGSAHGGR